MIRHMRCVLPYRGGTRNGRAGLQVCDVRRRIARHLQEEAVDELPWLPVRRTLLRNHQLAPPEDVPQVEIPRRAAESARDNEQLQRANESNHLGEGLAAHVLELRADDEQHVVLVQLLHPDLHGATGASVLSAHPITARQTLGQGVGPSPPRAHPRLPARTCVNRFRNDFGNPFRPPPCCNGF